ncbi:MAG: carbon-nitrogen hydrolase family protein [Lentisphaeria bacterium]|nr:carbon-nitrogen hydrolase family protein [Lentisphaeria bacterium]NQZ70627.1 carbon-nitrogen hydrolase family protein [Lentisphaeria bacterium]
MSLFTVALLQMSPEGNDQEKNLEKADSYCREAKENGAHLALMPEMFNCGYQGFTTEDPQAFRDQAIGPEDDFYKHFVELAKELDMAIGLGYLEKWEPEPRNSLTVIDRHGKSILTYAKVHTCDFGEMEAACTPGDDFYVSELDIGTDSIKIGAMICYDREAPESARILMLKGAEVVLTPNACGLEEMRLDQFKTRAYENAMGMVMTNYGMPYMNGQSVVRNFNGYSLVQAGEEEGVFVATFDMEELRKNQKETIHGNAYRRPQRYGILSSDEVAEPYVRKNGFGKPFDRSER